MRLFGLTSCVFYDLFWFLCLALCAGCTTELTECGGPALEVNRLLEMRKNFFAFNPGPKASLVYPDPIKATGFNLVSATGPQLSQAVQPFRLGDLLKPESLESDIFHFVKIRTSGIDAVGSATPNGKGEYDYQISDSRYGEVMQYYVVAGLLDRYVPALGFSIDRSRPLYVLVSVPDNGKPANAFYEHNTFTGLPYRLMKFVGTGEFRPSADAKIGLHEASHNVIESASRGRRIDGAGELGAPATEAAFIHEGVADTLADSITDDPGIGRWLARNFAQISPGQPLRSAVDRQSDVLQYRKVMENDGTGAKPERYEVATWISRALWDIRSSFVGEDDRTGAIFFERLMLSGLGFLSENTSIRQFRGALLTADKDLHCGLHQRSIQKAFDSRGYRADPALLDQPLLLQAQPVGLNLSDNKYQVVALGPGVEGGFKVTITNPNSEVAEDVRLILESSDPNLHITLPLQGLGHLSGGKTVTIGTGMSFDFSVAFSIDRNAPVGRPLKYTLTLTVGNGPKTSLPGAIAL